MLRLWCVIPNHNKSVGGRREWEGQVMAAAVCGAMRCSGVCTLQYHRVGTGLCQLVWIGSHRVRLRGPARRCTCPRTVARWAPPLHGCCHITWGLTPSHFICVTCFNIIFLSQRCLKQALSLRFSNQSTTRLFSRPGRNTLDPGAHCSHPSSAKVWTAWSFNFTPLYAFLAWCLGIGAVVSNFIRKGRNDWIG